MKIGMTGYGYEQKQMFESVKKWQELGEVSLVYGRFNDFNLPWIPLDSSILKTLDHVQMIDRKNEQHIQRNQNLIHLNDGDLYFLSDSDWEPVVGRNGIIEEMQNDTEHDAYLIHVAEKNRKGNDLILAYHYKLGWTHSPGQIMQDENGILIASPNYKIKRIPKEDFYIKHHKISDVNEEYAIAQKDYWNQTQGGN